MQVLRYLTTTPAAHETTEGIKECFKYLDSIPITGRLTKAEKLQIVNLVPGSEVDVHVVYTLIIHLLLISILILSLSSLFLFFSFSFFCFSLFKIIEDCPDRLTPDNTGILIEQVQKILFPNAIPAQIEGVPDDENGEDPNINTNNQTYLITNGEENGGEEDELVGEDQGQGGEDDEFMAE